MKGRRTRWVDFYTNTQFIDKNFLGGGAPGRGPEAGQSPPNAHSSSVPGTYLVPADNPFIGATNFNGPGGQLKQRAHGILGGQPCAIPSAFRSTNRPGGSFSATSANRHTRK
jgi:hypothetical protein